MNDWIKVWADDKLIAVVTTVADARLMARNFVQNVKGHSIYFQSGEAVKIYQEFV